MYVGFLQVALDDRLVHHPAKGGKGERGALLAGGSPHLVRVESSPSRRWPMSSGRC